jgi:hypothetical protein
MFTTSWLTPGTIKSDEGFSVRPKRDRLIYREANRMMAVNCDMGGGGFALFISSVARWDDDPDNSIPPKKAQEILNNIRRALESQGQRVDFVP